MSIRRGRKAIRTQFPGPENPSGVTEDYIEDGLGCLSGSGRNTGPRGNRDKFRQRRNLHFLHHAVAVGLDGTLGAAQRAGGVLVGRAADDKFEDLPLARCQCCDMRANDIQLGLFAVDRSMTCNRPLNYLKKSFR